MTKRLYTCASNSGLWEEKDNSMAVILSIIQNDIKLVPCSIAAFHCSLLFLTQIYKASILPKSPGRLLILDWQLINLDFLMDIQ